MQPVSCILGLGCCVILEERSEERVCLCAGGREAAGPLFLRLRWNVNWWDCFSSLIRHKAMFKTSQTLGCLSVSPRETRERGMEGFLSLASSLPHNPSSCGLITNRKTEILQSGRGFTGRLRACVLLRLECQGFEVMLMKILLELQI